MKTRESGMPDEGTWSQFYDPELILDKLAVNDLSGNIADLGCGYGTFSIPAARRTSGLVYAIDIEAAMIEFTREKARELGLANVVTVHRDFISEGTGLADGSCEFVFLFNLLHAEQPLLILAEARRILAQGGKVGIIHWNFDPQTPRGPSMSIRPKYENCLGWLIQSSFQQQGGKIDLPPYHYGLICCKQ